MKIVVTALSQLALPTLTLAAEKLEKDRQNRPHHQAVETRGAMGNGKQVDCRRKLIGADAAIPAVDIVSRRCRTL